MFSLSQSPLYGHQFLIPTSPRPLSVTFQQLKAREQALRSRNGTSRPFIQQNEHDQQLDHKIYAWTMHLQNSNVTNELGTLCVHQESTADGQIFPSETQILADNSLV